jgi:hypothetical protein
MHGSLASMKVLLLLLVLLSSSLLLLSTVVAADDLPVLSPKWSPMEITQSKL